MAVSATMVPCGFPVVAVEDCDHSRKNYYSYETVDAVAVVVHRYLDHDYFQNDYYGNWIDCDTTTMTTGYYARDWKNSKNDHGLEIDYCSVDDDSMNHCCFHHHQHHRDDDYCSSHLMDGFWTILHHAYNDSKFP